MRYPYPIREWTYTDGYPKPNELDSHQWAWEFLRRNPEYQRLYNLFDSLPDSLTFPDGYVSIKHGKWKGTPWRGMRFLEDGACWYADPPPIKGETTEEYHERTKGQGQIMPFQDYMMFRFRLLPWILEPHSNLDEKNYFSDQWGEDSIPPHEMALNRSFFSSDGEYIAHQEKFIDPHYVVLAFDMRYPVKRQLKMAERIFNRTIDDLSDEEFRVIRGIDSFEKVRFPKRQVNEFHRYVQLLDAMATLEQLDPDSSEESRLDQIAAELYPLAENGHSSGKAVTKKLRRNFYRARTLRDSDFWKLPAGD